MSNEPYVTVDSGTLARIVALLQGLAPVLDAVQSEVWGEHARTNADQIRQMLAELPKVDMAYLDPTEWAGVLASYVHEGRIDKDALEQSVFR